MLTGRLSGEMLPLPLIQYTSRSMNAAGIIHQAVSLGQLTCCIFG
jgi:hypothetical protein